MNKAALRLGAPFSGRYALKRQRSPTANMWWNRKRNPGNLVFGCHLDFTLSNSDIDVEYTPS